jgi:hypothetical protein
MARVSTRSTGGNAGAHELESASSLDLAACTILQPPKCMPTRRSALGCYGLCKKPTLPVTVRLPPSAELNRTSPLILRRGRTVFQAAPKAFLAWAACCSTAVI